MARIQAIIMTLKEKNPGSGSITNLRQKVLRFTNAGGPEYKLDVDGDIRRR